MSFKTLYKLFIALICIFIFIPTLFIPTFSLNSNTPQQSVSTNNIRHQELSYKFEINDKGFVWPTPGYTRINSYFGRRSSPTRGASSFHLGIDIGAPQGSNLVAVTDARVISLGFHGSGGYSIILKSNNLQFIYHHVNPNYIIKVNDIVKAGQVIGKVGPKNVYGVKNNPYRDSSGKPTNGATTGPHLHLTIKKDGRAVNPLNYFK